MKKKHEICRNCGNPITPATYGTGYVHLRPIKGHYGAYCFTRGNKKAKPTQGAVRIFEEEKRESATR